MSDDEGTWPAGAADLVQAIADTKLVLGQRAFAWTLAGPSLEDDVGGVSMGQDEVGQVRQLFRLLEKQGRDPEWLQGARGTDELANDAALDAEPESWTAFLVAAALADRAAWYQLDAIQHPDLKGLVDRIGQDEWFHLAYHDARLRTLAASDPAGLQKALEAALPGVLAALGPATHDGEHDPHVASGFTDRPATELREALLTHLDELLDETDVSLDGVDRQGPAETGWDPVRRRVGAGGVAEAFLRQLRGEANAEFAIR